MNNKVILHADLNNFYASVACVKNPNLIDKPLAICGDPGLRHGIILAKNTKAKEMGIKTGQVVWQARELCPDLIIKPSNFESYVQYSKFVVDLFRNYTSHIQQFGIDEAWLDLSESAKNISEGEKLAHHLRNSIRNQLGISLSIGVSDNKIYSKFASDFKKPDAVTVITQRHNIDYFFSKPIKELIFIGDSTEKILNSIGVFTIGQLANTPKKLLYSLLGKNGLTLYDFAWGKDNSSVLIDGNSPNVKTIGNGITTAHDLKTYEDASITLYALCESVVQRARTHKYIGEIIKVSIKYSDLETKSFQTQLKSKSDTCYDLYRFSMKLLHENWNGLIPLRALSISLGNLSASNIPVQLSFMPEEMQREKYRNFELTIDKIRNKFGHFAIQRAIMIQDISLGQINTADEHIIHPESYRKDA